AKLSASFKTRSNLVSTVRRAPAPVLIPSPSRPNTKGARVFESKGSSEIQSPENPVLENFIQSLASVHQQSLEVQQRVMLSFIKEEEEC
ncbi:MAG: hypothetical protein K2X27_22975, partial [Candidatus Obscuribacterales bacterium]|nr:hypothetical protein [Candidatus Obscuribacterales bacterium]